MKFWRGIRDSPETVINMVRESHHFSVEEIKVLGNPKDAVGLTLADWMARGTGNALIGEELAQ